MKTTSTYFQEIKRSTDKSSSVKKSSLFKDMLSKHLTMVRSGDPADLAQKGANKPSFKETDASDEIFSKEDFDEETIELLKNLEKFTGKDEFFGKSHKVKTLAETYSSRVGSTTEKRIAKYRHLIEEKAKKYNLEPAMLASLVKQESNFNPYAVSHCGAMGMGQLMPQTARYLGVKDPFNAAQNLDGAAKYLSQQLTTFKGDIKKALAAYNAGPGAVKKYGGIPPYAETQNYVKSILSHYNQISSANLLSKKI